MATREEIVKFLQKSLTNIKEVIGKLDEIDKNLENISPNEASEEKDLVNETKQLFDDLFEKSSKTKDKFHQKYKKILRDKNNKEKEKRVQGNSSSENLIQSNNVNIEEDSLCIRDVLVDTDLRETANLNFDSDLYITLDKNESITEKFNNIIDINNERKEEKGIRSNVNKDLNEESDAQTQNSNECTKSKEKTTSIKKISILEQNKSKKVEVAKERDESERELDQGDTSAKDIDKNTSELLIRTRKSHEKEKLHRNDLINDVCNSKTIEYADKIIDTSQKNSDKILDVPKINEKITDTIIESSSSYDVENISTFINEKEVKAKEICETRSQSSDKDTERNNNLKAPHDSKISETRSTGRNSITEDSNTEIQNVEMIDSQEDTENNQESVSDDDVEMNEVENESNEEAKRTDDINISDEDNSKTGGKSLESDEIENSVSENSNTEANSSVTLTEDNPEKISDTTLESIPLKEENAEEQNKENIEARPRIRLVSLDKLMAKPKKCVTFDTSIIILTSSDEESTPKKPNESFEQNGTLKSALKHSPLTTKKTEEDIKSKKDKKKNDSDEDHLHPLRKSTRITDKVEEKQHQRTRLRSIFTRTKSNEWKGKNACESDNDDDRTSKKKSHFSHDKSKNKIKKSAKTNEKTLKSVQDKFSSTVYVPLPRIECDNLQEVCSKKNNIFHTQSILAKMAERSSKRRRKQDSDSSSSDSDKAHKRITKRKKKEKSKENSSSSDEEDAVKSCLGRSEKGGNNISGEEDSEDKNDEKEQSEKEDNQEDTSRESEDKTTTKEEQQKHKDKVIIKELTVELENLTRNPVAVTKTIFKNIRRESRRDNRDTVEIVSSDSEDDLQKKKKTNFEKKKKKKHSVLSDSDKSDEESESDDKAASDDSNNESDCSKDSDIKKKKSARRRIKRANDSSDSEEEISTRKQIRKLIDRDSLSETTKKAEAEEKERKARIAEKQKKYNAIIGETKDALVEKVVLELDDKTEKELLSVDPKLATKLKPHQASGIRFMWDACFESLKRAKNTAGSGCILAHCMGLGKTLQVVALTHTLLQNSELTGVNKVLVVCPVNTVLNWKKEFKQWLPRRVNFEIYELVSCKQMYEKRHRVTEWHHEGGVLIIGYTMFRNISNPDNKRVQKKVREAFIKGLVDPGPDFVVCDEGHLLKNEKTNLSIAMNRIKTARRIVLTGTPLQNNLKEYWCMVQFIKPNLLGTYKEYLNRFVNPIINGQYTDSTQHDIILMRKRSHVLHKLLDGVVQRKDYSVLEPYLPPKHEYVLFVRLSEVQMKIYKHYMDNHARKNMGSNKVSFIFVDFQNLQRICTHPRVLMDKSSERKDKLLDDEEESEGSLKDFIDDGEVSPNSSASSSSSSGSDSDSDASNKGEKTNNKKQQKARVTRAQVAQNKENGEGSDPEVIEMSQKEWWQEFCDGDELDNIENSGKLSLLFHLLRECEEIGDKILIFSQSLYTLNCIEYFLEQIDEATQNGETDKFGGYSGSWHIGLDYFRLDGSSSCDNRAAWCDMFNSPDNTRARLFLISTKAGGLGINLVAANRVIIFDVSWNPSHDIQSVYRVYRFGQTKPCYIYRFVTFGAMEMKIYERQVTKQAISKRVIDEQQIDRHYNQNDLQELYKCELIPKEERPIPLVPKDVLLGEMLQKYNNIIYKYHEHQSLLENKEEECLNEEERKAAWEEFENEKVLRLNPYSGGQGPTQFNMAFAGGLTGMNAQLIATALANIVRRDNPTWSEMQVQGIIPALVQQLKVQLSENDTSMYFRVQQEIQRMQAEAREVEFQRQMMHAIAQNQYIQAARQQIHNNNLGNMQINPSTIRQMYNNMYTRAPNMMGASSSRQPSMPTTDIIELND